MPARLRADARRCEATRDPGRFEALADQGPPPLRRACGHVAGDPAIIRRGYRFYRGSGHELGGFLTRRFTLEDGRGASVTLLAGIDIETGAGMLDRCGTTDEAVRELQRGPGSVWAVVLTLENATVSWRELNRKLMIGDPSAFGAFAAELSGCRCSTTTRARCAPSAPARRLTASTLATRQDVRATFSAPSVPSGATSTPWLASCSRTRNWNVDQAPRRASNMR